MFSKALHKPVDKELGEMSLALARTPTYPEEAVSLIALSFLEFALIGLPRVNSSTNSPADQRMRGS